MDADIDYSLPYSSRRPIVCAKNIVATSQPLAAQAGARMLAAGGNAVDAALAAAMAATVVEPTGCGLGGDAFAIVWDGSRVHGLNGSGPSPARWEAGVFEGLQKMPSRGWASVTVPGVVASWEALSRRFGRLPFARLFEPAISYARDGFMVSPVIATLWAAIAHKYQDQPGFRECFLPAGRAPAPGEAFANPGLAASLEMIAREGSDAFYRGGLAEKLLAWSQLHGGLLSKEDLAGYEPFWCGTIQKDLGGATIHEIPPNTQGIATLIGLGILSRFDLGQYAPDSAEFIHLCIEAMKLAFADTEAYIADQHLNSFDVQSLLSDEYLSGRAALIDPASAKTYAAGAPAQGGTVYICAADENGMMVSFIQSNYEGFGSGVVVPETGISMQNRGMGFSLQAGHPNCVGPRKRPFHTIIPGFATKGNSPLMAFGVMGGPMQAQGHMQVALRTLVFKQNPQAAIDAPRWQYRAGKEVLVERAMPAEVVEGLRQRGHEVSVDQGEAVFSFGGAQIIRRTADGYVAGSDHRKDGMAVGF
ncbi:gamma-glutamyltransferase family protein [Pusillimonas caeni]|uniref:gamma-glutamyltransferase family protein n=1 Tax=Pusillimonas caeni TaxID=1348472 RepID=UPI000E59EB69|nr:gamma-glutamyltransferase family protein [Pusillimonas caeni]TFL14119.1 gamma-glutamyltransferase family protein [Pusillimonas caeni]